LSANIRSGALDLSVYQPVVPYEDGPALKSALPGSTWADATFMNISGWSLDIDDAKFGMKDERMRQAISIAVDRDGWYKYLGQPEGFVYKTPLPPYAPWWIDPKKDAQLSQYYKRDIAKAKQLMSAAGFPSGLQDVTYAFNANAAASTELASLQQDALKEAGINVKLTPLPQAQWFSNYFTGNTGSSITAGIGIFNTDPDEGISLVFDPESARSPIPNRKLLANDTKLIDLMSKVKSELDRNKRKGFVDEIQRHLSQKMYLVGGIAENRHYFAAKKVKNMGWVVHYAYGPILGDVWIDG
jgi:peptide/nickel transport system substrate-binding protein